MLTGGHYFGTVAAMESVMTELGFPVIEERSFRHRSVLREWKEAIEKHGPLLPRPSIPFCVDLSRQRVKELIDQGRIATVEVHNREYVPMAALEVFLAEERKSGRPVADVVLGSKVWRDRSRDLWKDLAKEKS